MSMKVLLSDPDWRFSHHTTAYLEGHAHLVVNEARAQAAIERLAHWKPDLVILSAESAENGLLEAAYAIKPRPAVLLTGAMDRYAEAWRAWQVGGDELLMKPVFGNEDLQQAIITAMENAATGAKRRSAPTAVSA